MEFTSYIEFLTTFLFPVTIMGDINICLEHGVDPDTVKLLESFDMVQYVTKPK